MNKKSITRLSKADLLQRRGKTKKDAKPGPSYGVDFWKDAQLVHPASKKPVTLRLDADLLDWFRHSGPGYQTRINAVLRIYVEAQQ